MKRGIAILGSTGSIGTQAIQLVSASPDEFLIVLLSGHKNAALLIKQIEVFRPRIVVVTDEKAYKKVSNATKSFKTIVLFGEENLLFAIESSEIQIVLNALVGFAGLKPLLHAIKHHKQILLANKESLVVAGELVMHLAKENQTTIIPIDSEHSAIFQCLQGENKNSIEKIILTASGGPFLNYSSEEFKNVTPEMALQHPVWKMGKKVTVDSASMMNKGLEVIEARWLFEINPDKIDVVIHPQSVIHSFVQFIDGSLKAQLSKPDMRLPIQYALSYPERNTNNLVPFSFTDNSILTFRQVNREKFRNLALSFGAIKKGGNMPAILNASNEVAVQAFLEKKLPFYRIPDVVEEMMASQPFFSTPDLETYFETTKKCQADSLNYIRKKI